MLSTLALPFKTMYRARYAFADTLIDEIRRKYAGSVFGFGWLLLLPLLFLVFYSAVYLVVFKVKPVGMNPAEYVLFIYIGLMPFLSFSESLTSGAGSLLSNKSVLMNTVFPAELLPIRTVAAAQATFVVGMLIATIWAMVAGHASVWMLLLPIVMMAQVLFLSGVALFLAPLFLAFRDLGQLLNFAVLGLLVVSPIAYRPEDLAGSVRLLLNFNPLYYFLTCYQSIIFDGIAPPTHLFVASILGGLFTFICGFWFCNRVKMAFSEYA